MSLENDLIDVSGEMLDDGVRSEDEMECEIPPRPTSRLGFNGPGDSNEDPDDDDDEFDLFMRRSEGGILEWTLGVSGRNLSSPDADGGADMNGTDVTGSDGEGAEYGDGLLFFHHSHPQVPSSSFQPPQPPSPPPQSTSQQTMDDDEVIHPFSCLPSPLSPCYVNEPHPLRPKSPTLPRHDLRHHGRSHSALIHTKWFWSMREEEWTDFEGPEARDVDKLTKSPTMRQSLPSLANNSSLKKPRKFKQAARFSPFTVHPRRGDIAALRDPYSAHVDRCLAEWPMWTIAKTLWMFDMQMGLERLRKARELCGDEDADSTGESDDSEPEARDVRALSTSSGFSDDSDITLVESDVEVDEEEVEPEDPTLDDIVETPRECLAAEPSASTQSGANKGRFSPDFLPQKLPSSLSLKTSPKSLSKASLTSHQTKPRCLTRPPYFSPNFLSLARHLGNRDKLHDDGWETDSYRRWDLLIDIVRLDQDTSFRYTSSPPRASGSRSRRFFFASESDDTEGSTFC